MGNDVSSLGTATPRARELCEKLLQNDPSLRSVTLDTFSLADLKVLSKCFAMNRSVQKVHIELK
jgi:hypothetical protein